MFVTSVSKVFLPCINKIFKILLRHVDIVYEYAALALLLYTLLCNLLAFNALNYIAIK
jgi:hypothetical protein